MRKCITLLPVGLLLFMPAVAASQERAPSRGTERFPLGTFTGLCGDEITVTYVVDPRGSGTIELTDEFGAPLRTTYDSAAKTVRISGQDGDYVLAMPGGSADAREVGGHRRRPTRRLLG